MALSDDEIEVLALRYEGFRSLEERLYAMMCDVADRYCRELEGTVGKDDPAPGLCDTTPVEITLLGLKDDLHIRRGGS
jgi:hypothetical protein